MTEESSYSLVVAFPDESASFVNGFEAGQIWNKMDISTAVIEQTIHSENRTVVERMAANQGYQIDFSPTDFNEWVAMIARKVARAPERVNPHGLKSVK